MKEKEELIKDFHKRLDWLQFERSFSECQFLIVDQDVHGFGGQLSRRMLGLQLGYIFDRTTVFCRPNDPPYQACYLPTGKYTIDDIGHVPPKVFEFSTYQKDKVVYFDFWSFWKHDGLKRWFYSWIPPEFIRNGYDRRFFDGQILTRFKLLDEYRANIERTKERIGFKKPIIGVHIRRGDKFEETPYVPLKIFIDKVKKISEKTGIRKVFVTSDSEDTIKKLPLNVELEYIYDKNEKRYNNANYRFLTENPFFSKQETLTATKILELLALCDWIVCQDNTHLSLLAAALNAARTQNRNRCETVRGDYLSAFATASLKYWPWVFWERYKKYIIWTINRSRLYR